MVGVDSARNELVVGIVGEWLRGRSIVCRVIEWTRLCEDVYIGQKTGKLD